MQVFVTGAAGLIGNQVAKALCEKGHQVTGLIHRARPSAGQDAMTLLEGDIGEPRLGLEAGTYARLAETADLIVHCAAVTEFGAPARMHQRVNVQGTDNVIVLAERAGCPMLHVSTAYVCGDKMGDVSEDQPASSNRYCNGYEESKAQAERLIYRARERGLPAVIARPSIVMGEWATGKIDGFCDVYRFVRLIAEGRIRTLPVAPAATLDFVPLDHVVRSICALTDRMSDAAGGNFHIVSERPCAVADFTAAIAAYPGMFGPRLVPPEAYRPESLPRPERRYHDRATSLYAAYLQRDPRFRADNLRAITGLACPPVDAAYFSRLLRFAVGSGFMRPLLQAA